MITFLKLHQKYFPKEKIQPKTPKTAPAEAATASAEAVIAPAKLQTTPAEAEIPYAEAETIPAHSAVALVVVPEKSHKVYLTIFSQIINLMANTFLQANDVIQITSSSCNNCD